MYRDDNFKQKESVGQAFYHSCLGKLVILAIVIVILLLIAIIAKPSKNTMIADTTDGILECIENNDSIKGDKIDDYMSNFAHVFTTADTTQINPDLMAGLRKYNRMEIHDHTFFRTAYILNNIYPQGVRVGIGMFGIVYPTVLYKDLLLNVGPMQKNYKDGIIRSTVVKPADLGTNPAVKPFHYQGDPDQ
jgi:hypothetical protein